MAINDNTLFFLTEKKQTNDIYNLKIANCLVRVTQSRQHERAT